MTDRSVVTAKGQVTIPKPVRDRLGIHAADVVEFEVRQGEAILRPARAGFLARFASVAPRERPERWARVRQGVAADVSRRAAGDRRG